MNCIADILEIDVSEEPWDGKGNTPYYLLDSYDFMKVTLEGIPCLVMSPTSGELETLTTLKKHIAKVTETEKLPIVLELKSISAKRRKSLIAARIPFVAPGCQIYLPFMGIVLTERYSTEKPLRETLMPSSQLLFFYYLYQQEAELHTSGLSDKLNSSAMQVSRAIRQLNALELISVRKDGVRIAISGNGGHRVLFERAKPYLLNPIRKKTYVDFDTIPTDTVLSGLSALSEMTMLAPPDTKTVAYFGKVGDISGTNTLVDNNEQAEVEVWKYPPALLSCKPGVADVLSLAATFQATKDERVEQAVEEMLEELWGGNDG